MLEKELMTSKIVATWTIPKLPIVAKTADGWNLLEEQFPIHRIYCVGRNYREHAAEMVSETTSRIGFDLLKSEFASSHQYQRRT